MSSMKIGYDISPMTYSPEGRLFQHEYCNSLLKNSPTICGVLCKDGILLSREGIILNETNLYNHLSSMFVSLGKGQIACSNGIPGDISYVLERLRKEITLRRGVFAECIDNRFLLNSLVSLYHLHSSYWHLRPLACSFLFGSIINGKPQLAISSIIGVKKNCFSIAFGKNHEVYSQYLEHIIKSEKKTQESLEILSLPLKKINLKNNHSKSYLGCLSFDYSRFYSPPFNLERNLLRSSIKDN
mmetsp:Transcript_44933/g.70432  ORF Transcript_44933/g.70432 Transcript_44933/m.70432 type:complete len:242 (+) Transcript_44933:2317-3042(+)